MEQTKGQEMSFMILEQPLELQSTISVYYTEISGFQSALESDMSPNKVGQTDKTDRAMDQVKRLVQWTS